MKFIHLSDLHLGKRVFEFSMIEDQKYILQQILDWMEEEQPDGVILAGDLYDKPVPSGEAVQLFDWFLTELAERNVTVLAISGNHDSAERIAFGAGLMSGRNVHFSPVYDGNIKCVTMEDGFGPVHVWLMPFVKPAVVRQALREEDEQAVEVKSMHAIEQESAANATDEKVQSAAKSIQGYQSAVEAVVQRMNVNPEERNVLVSHQFVTGAARCESEEINVGGLDQISGETFDDFDYVALGHIHSPQRIGRETVRYCGTPLKYSFSEAEQTKSMTVVEMKEKGKVEIRTIPLRPLRDMRKIRGTYMELMDSASYKDTNPLDYVQITLTDEEDIPDGLQKLRIVYPNVMQLNYDNLRTQTNQEITALEEMEQKSEMELFEEFFELQNNQAMSEEQREFVGELIEKLR